MPRTLKAVFFGIALSVAVASPGDVARAQVGARNFYSAMITYGTDPQNDLTLAPGWASIGGKTEATFTFSLEKLITDNTSIYVGDSVSDASRRRSEVATGLANVEILGKWAFYMNPDHEFRGAIALDIFAPTGSIDAGSGGHWRMGPMLLAEKGFGDLPDNRFFHYLRPFAVQADAEYLPRVTGSQSDFTFFDAALSYQLDYLVGDANDFPGESLLKPVVFFNEFNYQQIAWGRQTSTPPDWRVTPGIAYNTQYYQLAAATQFGINNQGAQATNSTGIFQIDIYYDQIFPVLGGHF